MGLRRARRKHLLSEPLVFSYGSEPRAICLYPEPICCCLVNIGSQYSLSLFLTLEWEKGPQTQRALPKAHRLPWSIQRGGRECESEGETGKETERVPFLSIISVFPHFPKFIPFRLSPSGYSSSSNAWVVKLLPARKECGSQFPRTEGTLIHLEPSQKCLKFLILCLPPPNIKSKGVLGEASFFPQTAPSIGHTGNLHPALTEVGSIPERRQQGHLHCLGAGSKGELGPWHWRGWGEGGGWEVGEGESMPGFILSAPSMCQRENVLQRIILESLTVSI